MGTFLESQCDKNGQEPDTAKTNVGGLFLFFFFPCTPPTRTQMPCGETVLISQNGNHGRGIVVLSK